MNADQVTLGEALRDEGTARVDMAEPEDWKVRCDAAIAQKASTGQPFTAEDIREMVGDPLKSNAFGARFLKASKAGLIRCIGRRRAERPSLHAHELRLWVGVPSPS